MKQRLSLVLYQGGAPLFTSTDLKKLEIRS